MWSDVASSLLQNYHDIQFIKETIFLRINTIVFWVFYQVQGEVRKKWIRWRMGVRKKSKRRTKRRQWYTSTSYYSNRNRSSQQSLQSFGLEKNDSSSQEGAQICQRCLMERRQFRVYVERCRRMNGHVVRVDADDPQPMFRVTFERESGFWLDPLPIWNKGSFPESSGFFLDPLYCVVSVLAVLRPSGFAESFTHFARRRFSGWKETPLIA